MPALFHAPYGLTALFVFAGGAFLVAAVCAGVKLRAASRRGFGVRVYDLGADLTLPRRLHSRSYQIAFYLTMKSLPREPVAGARKISARAAIR
jgi:hypothetical protein